MFGGTALTRVKGHEFKGSGLEVGRNNGGGELQRVRGAKAVYRNDADGLLADIRNGATSVHMGSAPRNRDMAADSPSASSSPSRCSRARADAHSTGVPHQVTIAGSSRRVARMVSVTSCVFLSW